MATSDRKQKNYTKNKMAVLSPDSCNSGAGEGSQDMLSGIHSLQAPSHDTTFFLSKEALRAQEFTCKPTSRHHCTLPWSFSACSQLPPKPSSRRREMKNSQFSSYLRWYRASDRTETIMHLPSFSMQPLTSSPEAEEAMASTPSPDTVGSHPPNVPQSQKGLNPVGTSYP